MPLHFIMRDGRDITLPLTIKEDKLDVVLELLDESIQTRDAETPASRRSRSQTYASPSAPTRSSLSIAKTSPA